MLMRGENGEQANPTQRLRGLKLDPDKKGLYEDRSLWHEKKQGLVQKNGEGDSQIQDETRKLTCTSGNFSVRGGVMYLSGVNFAGKALSCRPPIRREREGGGRLKEEGRKKGCEER